MDGSSGIAIDGEDAVYVADTHNGRVQKFTADGRHLLTFGSGELDLPWGADPCSVGGTCTWRTGGTTASPASRLPASFQALTAVPGVATAS